MGNANLDISILTAQFLNVFTRFLYRLHCFLLLLRMNHLVFTGLVLFDLEIGTYLIRIVRIVIVYFL